MNPSLEKMLFETRALVLGLERPVKGLSTKVPIGIFLQNALKEKEVRKAVAQAISDRMPQSITSVAGFGYDGIIFAADAAEITGKKLLPLQFDPQNSHIAGFEEEKPLLNENVAIVSGIIATGNNCLKAIEMVRLAGGLCQNVFGVFDYGFHLKKSAVFENFRVHSLTTLKSFAEQIEINAQLLKWLHDNSSLLRQVKDPLQTAGYAD